MSKSNWLSRLIGKGNAKAAATSNVAPSDSRRLPVPFNSFGFGGAIGNGIWGWGGGLRIHHDHDWRKITGDAIRNSAVAACLGWIVTSWPQAPAVLVRAGEDNQGEQIVAHALTDLLRQPSSDYDGRQLSSALLTDWWLRDDAFAYIIATDTSDPAVPSTGEPLELQFLPTELVRPIGPDGGHGGQIDHYEYRPQGQRISIAPENILHFRWGMDPRFPMRGRSPLRSGDPEIATDNEATRLQYKFLKRGGIGGVVLGPSGKDENGAVADIDDADAAFIKKQLAEKAEDVDDNVLIMPVAFSIGQAGFDPKSLVIGETQRKSEERIAALFQIPPVVAGLGAGLDRATFANYEEARRAAWQDNIIPTQEIFAAEIWRKLSPRYVDLATGKSGLTLTYDRSGIRCLREDESAKVKDSSLAFKSGVIDRWTAKRMLGVTPEEIDKGVYFAPAMGAGDELDPAANPPAVSPAKTPAKGGRLAAKPGTFRY